MVTEYHYHEQETLRIEVELYSADELREQLRALLDNYRYYHLNSEEMDDADEQHFGALADLAEDTFRAMFRGRLNDEGMLLTDAEGNIMRRFMSWVESLRPSNGNMAHSALSIAECSRELIQLSSDVPGRNRPATWPYTKKIKSVLLHDAGSLDMFSDTSRVFLNAYILSAGLVLVDLPGMSKAAHPAPYILTDTYEL